jgi:hypothetical protein
MLFRDLNGNIIQINKNEFITDSDYYKKIGSIYGFDVSPKNDKKENSKNKILDFIKQKK